MFNSKIKKMKKIVGFCLFIVLMVALSFCEKKEPKEQLPIGKVVTFEWADTIGGTLYGIMREQATGKPHVAVAELNSDGSFKVIGIDGSKSEPALQQICHCNSCGYEWAPRSVTGCCVQCPASGHPATSAFCYTCSQGYYGYCWFVWIE